METVISILGSIASVGGAIWAFVQARRAASSASEAAKVRDEFINRRKIVEISQVHSETKKALDVVKVVGPAASEHTIRGLDLRDVVTKVEEYSQLLNEQSAHFDEMFDNRAKTLCQSLGQEIPKLANASSPSDALKAGNTIYSLIYDFVPVAKEYTDRTKEKQP